MTRVIPVPIRREIVTRHQQGEPLKAIAQSLQLSYWGVRKIWRQHRREPTHGLSIGYANSGRRGHRCSHKLYRCAIWLKRRHPSWGASFILVILKERYESESLPHPRTLQRWFQAQHLSIPKTHHPVTERVRAQSVHQTWQLDATSHQRLADGTPASWISLVDEHSGALLESRAFPPVHF